MMKIYAFILIILFHSVKTDKRYRNDYVYYAKSDAFYKLHIEMESVSKAKTACRLENSELMVPQSEYDLIQAHGMFKSYPDLGPYLWLGKDRMEHENAEEHLVIDLESPRGNEVMNERCEVLTRRGRLLLYPCYHKLPFVCRVSAADAPKQELCRVYGLGYTYNATVDRCYKVSNRSVTWSEAASECAAENANLAVLRSAAQRDAVLEVLKRSRLFATDARASWFYLLGFRAIRNEKNEASRVFLTLYNETLEQAGFAEWSPNEPNNYGSREDCGSLFRNDGRLNDVSCSHKYRYICEKQPPRDDLKQ